MNVKISYFYRKKVNIFFNLSFKALQIKKIKEYIYINYIGDQ